MKFTKVHGLGNDFIILNGFDEEEYIPSKLYRELAVTAFSHHGDFRFFQNGLSHIHFNGHHSARFV